MRSEGVNAYQGFLGGAGGGGGLVARLAGARGPIRGAAGVLRAMAAEGLGQLFAKKGRGSRSGCGLDEGHGWERGKGRFTDIQLQV